MKVTFEDRPALHGTRIAIATLDAPRQLNALSLPMIEALLDQFHSWATDPAVVCVLLRGNGPKAFCAGGDVRKLAEACRSEPGTIPPLAERFFADEYRLIHRMHDYPKPLICWGHGYVMGGGMGLLQAGTFRIVTPDCRLAMPEVSIGLHTDVGASWFLPRLPGRLGSVCRPHRYTDQRARCAGPRPRRSLSARRSADRAAGRPGADHWQEQADSQLHSLLRALGRQAAERLPDARLLPRRTRIDELLDVAELPHAWQALTALQSDPDELLAESAHALSTGCP